VRAKQPRISKGSFRRRRGTAAVDPGAALRAGDLL